MPAPDRSDCGTWRDWIGQYRRLWEDSFERLDDYLRELQEKEHHDDARDG